MKRFFLITALALATLVIVLCGTIVLTLKNNTIYQYLISRVNTTIPGTLSIGNLRTSLLGLEVEIRDFALADSSGKKLAGFDRLLVDISPFGLIRRLMVVQNAVLEHPWAVLEVDSSGRLSLLDAFPHGEKTPPDTIVKPKSKSKPFIVKLLNLDIIGGTVIFAAQQDSLKVQAYGLAIAANGETGTLSADVKVQFDSIALEQTSQKLQLYDLNLMAKMNNLEIDTVDFKVKTHLSSFTIKGRASSLTDNPLVNLAVTADLALSEIRSISGLNEELSGKSKLVMNLSGRISNPDLIFDVNYGGGIVWGYPVKSLIVKAMLTDRVLELKPVHVDAPTGSIDIVGGVDVAGMFPDGFLKAPGSVQQLKYNLAISGQNVSLQELAPGLSGTAAIKVALNGQGVHPDSLAAKVNLSTTIEALQLDTGSIPLNFAIACSAAVMQGTAHIHTLAGKLGDTELSLAGSYGILSGKMNADLNIAAPSLDTMLKFTGTDSISGSATVKVHVGGDLKNPQATIDLKADTVAFGAVIIGNVALSADLDKNGTARVKQLTLINRNSKLKLSGSSRVLHKGTPVPLDRMVFDLSLTSQGMVIGDFIDSIGGKITIDTKINGTIKDPRGNIKLSATDLYAAGQSIEQITLDASLEQQRATIKPLRIVIVPGQELAITGWASLTDSFNIALSTKGIHLKSIAALAAVDSLDGLFSMDLHAGGTYLKPDVLGKLGIRSIRMGALAPDDIALQLQLHNNQVEVTGKALGDLHASYNLDTKEFKTDLTLNNLLLTPYLALSGQTLDGSLSAAVKVSGNTDSLTAITANLNIGSLILNYKDIRVIETRDLKAILENNRYTVPDFKIILAGEGSLTGRAHGLIEGPHDITLNGTIPLIIARHFSPDLPDIEGNLVIDASLKGTPKKPDLSANIQLKNIGMTIPGLNGRLHSLNGQILADNKAVKIESLRGNIDDGVLSMNGEIILKELAPSDVTANITLKDLPVGVPDMLDLVLDGKLNIAGSPDSTQITGDIILLDGLYYQDIIINPLAVVGPRKRKVNPPPVENTTPYLKNMRFDIGVQARSPFQVDNNMAQLTITPDLQLMGSLQAPALNGRAKVDQGTITYQKKVFTVERGVIDFVNPYAIEPQIDISGSIPIKEDTIQIVITGTPDDLGFKLSSNNPSLEDQDLLSLLVIGRTTAELQKTIQSDSGGGGQSNQQMLASLVASTFGDDLKKATGLDYLEVETGDKEDEDSDRIAVTMGKKITKQLSTKYTVESENGEFVHRTAAEYWILQNFFITGFHETGIGDAKQVFGGALRLNWEKR
jgi:autotransporter translocation and assembly factor TamB